MISIITITYNAANELPRTMQSVAEQTCQDFEHIIVDGASKDNTLEIARQMGTKSLRILSEPDHGLYDAMNKGLDLAQGEYILFLNAGDTFHDANVLARYAEAAKQHPDIIYADTDHVDAEGKYLGPRHLSAPEQLTFDSYKNGMLVCHQAFMVRAGLVRENDIRYDLQWRFSADYEWCLRCIKATTPDRCINLHTVAIDYLQEGLTTKNHKASLKERYRIMCRNYGTLPSLLRHLRFALRHLRK